MGTATGMLVSFHKYPSLPMWGIHVDTYKGSNKTWTTKRIPTMVLADSWDYRTTITSADSLGPIV